MRLDPLSTNHVFLGSLLHDVNTYLDAFSPAVRFERKSRQAVTLGEREKWRLKALEAADGSAAAHVPIGCQAVRYVNWPFGWSTAGDRAEQERAFYSALFHWSEPKDDRDPGVFDFSPWFVALKEEITELLKAPANTSSEKPKLTRMREKPAKLKLMAGLDSLAYEGEWGATVAQICERADIGRTSYSELTGSGPKADEECKRRLREYRDRTLAKRPPRRNEI